MSAAWRKPFEKLSDAVLALKVGGLQDEAADLNVPAVYRDFAEESLAGTREDAKRVLRAILGDIVTQNAAPIQGVLSGAALMQNGNAAQCALLASIAGTTIAEEWATIVAEYDAYADVTGAEVSARQRQIGLELAKLTSEQAAREAARHRDREAKRLEAEHAATLVALEAKATRTPEQEAALLAELERGLLDRDPDLAHRGVEAYSAGSPARE